jgi:hypothetical protein
MSVNGRVVDDVEHGPRPADRLRGEVAQMLDRDGLRFCGMIELICTKAFGT